MDKGYEGFCLNDPLFYDSPMLARDDDVDFCLGRAPVPVGWSRDELDDWLVYTPVDARFPNQGWKIHSSASLVDAEKILQVVWEYCIPRHIAFKFVRSAQLLLLANGKYAHRGSSGKFITIYPTDDVALETIVSELGDALAGFEGPYILSDVRWRDGPLYLRYGAFAERYCLSDSGDVVPAVEDPSGELVPDRRGATFEVPSWAAVPEFLLPAIAARASDGLADLPYRVERPLHFSNGGGVYAATDVRSGEHVVLKEARPYAGLAIDETDAVTRLQNERRVLERLAGLDVVPGVRDYFTLGGHHFLVLDFVAGVPLGSTMADWYPLVLLGDERPFAAYADWAVELLGRVRVAVSQVHGRGVVVGDLHPNNILVGSEGEVRLIDLEIASDVEAGLRSPLGDPGFSAPMDRVGYDIDEYALACIEMSMFLPLTELFNLDASKVGQYADEIAATFPLPPGFLDRAVRVITGPADAVPARTSSAAPVRFDDYEAVGWPALREAMSTAILASATPERDDRLFPGDIAQFESGGLNLAHGAAGVLHALQVTGAGRFPEHEDWLVKRALNPMPGTRLGFYDGLHGVAYTLQLLGRHDDALEVLAICTSELEGAWQDLSPDLFSGLAGIGLNLAHFAETTGDASLWSAAANVAEVVADGLGDVDDVPVLSGKSSSHAGLLRGSTGPALLFIRLYEHFREDQLLDLAATALRQDLRRCVVRDDGALEVNEGYRTMPYLYDGSIGVGMVLDDFLRLRPDEEFAEASSAARIAALADFYIEPGLFSGRAGMVAYLSRHETGRQTDAAVITSHLRRLAWHAVAYEGGIAFPGEQLLRLSMDLATGTAGVLFAVGTALHDEPISLPFLGPPPRGPNNKHRRR